MLGKLRRLFRFFKWILAETEGWEADQQLLENHDESIGNLEQREGPSLSELIDDDPAALRSVIEDQLAEINWADQLEITATTEIEVEG